MLNVKCYACGAALQHVKLTEWVISQAKDLCHSTNSSSIAAESGDGSASMSHSGSVAPCSSSPPGLGIGVDWQQMRAEFKSHVDNKYHTFIPLSTSQNKYAACVFPVCVCVCVLYCPCLWLWEGFLFWDASR